MKYEKRYFLDFVYWIIIIGIGGTMFMLREEKEDICLLLFAPFLVVISLMIINWYKAKQQKKGE